MTEISLTEKRPRRKLRKECCAYCGVYPAPERDHIPPRCFYPSPTEDSKVQRLTVPACSNCNRGYSDDEAHFRNVMLLAGDDNQAVRELWPTAMRSFREVDGRKRLWDIRLLVETVQIDGIERWVIYPARDERILRIVRKVVRGLSYHHRLGTVFTDECVWTDVLKYPIPASLLASKMLHHGESEIFEYWYQTSEDGDCSSRWLLKFLEKRVFVASIVTTSFPGERRP